MYHRVHVSTMVGTDQLWLDVAISKARSARHQSEFGISQMNETRQTLFGQGLEFFGIGISMFTKLYPYCLDRDTIILTNERNDTQLVREARRSYVFSCSYMQLCFDFVPDRKPKKIR